MEPVVVRVGLAPTCGSACDDLLVTGGSWDLLVETCGSACDDLLVETCGSACDDLLVVMGICPVGVFPPGTCGSCAWDFPVAVGICPVLRRGGTDSSSRDEVPDCPCFWSFGGGMRANTVARSRWVVISERRFDFGSRGDARSLPKFCRGVCRVVTSSGL
jgi:hypothetical protein